MNWVDTYVVSVTRYMWWNVSLSKMDNTHLILTEVLAALLLGFLSFNSELDGSVYVKEWTVFL